MSKVIGKILQVILLSCVSVSGHAQTEPVLYIVSMMHAEDSVPFHELQVPFRNTSAALMQLDLLFNEHNAKIDFGPDWSFIRGVLRWDPTLLQDHQNLGQGIQTHAHETAPGYDLKNVNQLLSDAGLSQNVVANGGFTNPNTPLGENWVGYIDSIKDEEGEPVFTSIIGYKNPMTQVPDGTGFVFRPSKTGDWRVHDQNGALIYIGSNTDEVAGGGVLDFAALRPWVDDRLARLDPNKINTLYWHDSLHKYTDPTAAALRIERWERELIEYFDPLVVNGKVEWKTFAEITQIYLDQESLMFESGFE